jgi:predicted O-linked N-acetylglucosamine transferase (SPINDLY family)
MSTAAQLWQQGHREEALEHLRAATKAAPQSENALYRYVAASYVAGNLRAARAAAMSAQPAALSERVLNSLTGVLSALGRVDEAVLLLRSAARQAPENYELARSIAQMLLYSDKAAPAQIAEAHRHAARLLVRGLPETTLTPRRDSACPLRVGYLSQDFRNRSAAHFIEGVFRHHDPQAVIVLAYSVGLESDNMTATLKGHVTEWREIGKLTDDEAAALVRADGVDILVDLCGLSNLGRLGVMARRPAPVQVTYMGYPWSTGLPAMQYRLVDALTDPPGTEEHSTEKLVRLPGCFLCYTPPDHAPAVQGLPALRDDVITFGSFNIMAKVSPTTIRLWAGALRKTPGSRMLIKANDLDLAEAQDELVNAFAREGISSSRLIIRGPTPTAAEHMAMYHEVDIALDTYPYHGTTTTLEAIHMGVPVVTMVGPVHPSRVGLSLLTAVGMPELAATTPEGFAAAAAKLASDLEALGELRRGMRERLAKSTLCEGPGFVRRLEETYRAMWDQGTPG